MHILCFIADSMHCIGPATSVVIHMLETARILIVDDESLNRDMLSRRLRKQGYQTTQVEDGANALALLAGDLQFDLVLLDQNMPGISGIEVLAAVRKRYSAT